MRSWIGAVAAAALLVGCATAAPGPTAGPGPATGSAAYATIPATRTDAATGSSRAAAVARHLVAEMTFPPGTRPASLRSVPRALRDPGPPGPGWAHAQRLLLAPVKPAAVWAAVLPHAPFNEDATMGQAVSSGAVGSTTMQPAPEPGIAADGVAVWVEPWSHGTALIAAYAYAAWLPVRTPAEHLNPGRFRAVTISAEEFIPRPHETTRVFTSAAVITRLAAFLNGRRAAPQLAFSCPAPAVSYQLRFTGKQSGDPRVTVSLGCLTDQITVNGAAQPLLWDNQGGLARMIRELLDRSLFLARRRTTYHLRSGYREHVEAQTPPPELVTASRRHLTERYASGVDRLLWNREKCCLPDLAAIKLVTDAALAGLADALDLGAALVLVHAGRLHLDGLEYEIFQGAHAAGMRREALAAILGLPDAAAVSERQQWLESRHAMPRAEAEEILPVGPGHAEAAARAGRRAVQAASRAAEVARRREELGRQLLGRDPRSDHPEHAIARAYEARLLVDEAAERAALGLKRAAAALDRYAIRCAELSAAADGDQARRLRRKADEYRQAAARYREMAARYGDRGPGDG